MNSLSDREGKLFAVKFRNLCLNYGKIAGLDNVSLDIPAQKIHVTATNTTLLNFSNL